jgi:hypothetical protein
VDGDLSARVAILEVEVETSWSSTLPTELDVLWFVGEIISPIWGFTAPPPRWCCKHTYTELAAGELKKKHNQIEAQIAAE